jgi:hypothetical protein
MTTQRTHDASAAGLALLPEARIELSGCAQHRARIARPALQLQHLSC